MAGISSADLYDVQAEFLALCIRALAETPEGPPARSFVSPSPPPWDCCPFLAVNTTGPAVAETLTGGVLGPGHRLSAQGIVHLISLVATIIRCDGSAALDPTDGPPPASLLQETAEQTSADMWAIWNRLRAEKKAGLVFAPIERAMFLDPTTAVLAEGGCVGWQVNIRVQLDGYPVPGVGSVGT